LYTVIYFILKSETNRTGLNHPNGIVSYSHAVTLPLLLYTFLYSLLQIFCPATSTLYLSLFTLTNILSCHFYSIPFSIHSYKYSVLPLLLYTFLYSLLQIFCPAISALYLSLFTITNILSYNFSSISFSISLLQIFCPTTSTQYLSLFILQIFCPTTSTLYLSLFFLTNILSCHFYSKPFSIHSYKYSALPLLLYTFLYSLLQIFCPTTSTLYLSLFSLTNILSCHFFSIPFSIHYNKHSVLQLLLYIFLYSLLQIFCPATSTLYLSLFTLTTFCLATATLYLSLFTLTNTLSYDF
jgi:hypothetical protein